MIMTLKEERKGKGGNGEERNGEERNSEEQKIQSFC